MSFTSNLVISDGHSYLPVTYQAPFMKHSYIENLAPPPPMLLSKISDLNVAQLETRSARQPVTDLSRFR